MNQENSGRYANELKSAINDLRLSIWNEECTVLLGQGEAIGEFLSDIIKEFVDVLSFENIPPSIRAHVRERSEALVYFGLFMHCLLFTFPTRNMHEKVNKQELFASWNVESLATHATLKWYDRNFKGLPSAIFAYIYEKDLEPAQKRLGHGWWRRCKNEIRFRNLFVSGMQLGMMFDNRTKRVSGV